MPDPAPILLSFRLHRQWKPVLGLTLAGVLLYQITTLQRGEHHEFAPLTQGHVWPYIKMFFGYYYGFELLSLWLFIRLAIGYRRLFKLYTLPPTLKAVLGYQLWCLPLILGSILLIGPLTNSLRYLVFFYPHYRWSTYFPDYVLTGHMFLNYSLPFLLAGYGLMNGNLLLDYRDYHQRRFERLHQQTLQQASNQELVMSDKPAYPTSIPGSDVEGEGRVLVDEIWYVEVEKKRYLAYTDGKTYQLRGTLGDLEAILDPQQFYRINRSVLLNLAYMKNYTYWEHDKYVVRLRDGKTEFIMQRSRLKGLRERLNQGS
ncbi:LytTR family DNA-binding domain-containing protein [Spirosoma oryzicola]|uniref:LytTR family DNA-binding domain-containing protein n=1 Tax=Spirosoma oryzicola TaxID=2898794 RepID=UPI001E4DA7DF|nr:LytTR family DNA-binding domain-containing protein [Spirosoma oryzicola]UHG94729.1 LytTR family transcriptional regulator [Spirosoma oryzicola]